MALANPVLINADEKVPLSKIIAVSPVLSIQGITAIVVQAQGGVRVNGAQAVAIAPDLNQLLAATITATSDGDQVRPTADHHDYAHDHASDNDTRHHDDPSGDHNLADAHVHAKSGAGGRWQPRSNRAVDAAGRFGRGGAGPATDKRTE